MLNFKKDGIFGRQMGTETGVPDPYAKPNQMLAVWGSPGSGKTTVAVKLAKELAAKKKRVILLLCDMTAPMIPCICPAQDLECVRSLGSVLAAARISESLVKQNLCLHKRYENLAVLGLQKGENEYTYPPYTASQAEELLGCLRALATYVIVDCGSYIANDILSAVTLMEANAVLRLMTCDLKCVSYYSSQLPLLRDHKWEADKQYKVASNLKTQEASGHMEQVLGSMAFKLYHSPELERQSLAGNLFEDLVLRDSKGVRRELSDICMEVFGC